MKYKTDPANILRTIDIVFQVFEKSTPRYGGLFPAVAERYNGQVLQDFPLPPIIPGQRNSDRSPRGNNLQHDIPLLATLHGFDQTLGRPSYHNLRTAYLETFATVCAPASPTGLLPWGEHAFWNLADGSIGNSYLLQYAERPLDAGQHTHHQLEILPLRDWEVINNANPDVLPRFVEGLDWHWMDDERTHFNRHAPLTQFIRGYPNKRHTLLTGENKEKMGGSDFPGAAGVFIHDYAAALALVDRPKTEWRDAMMKWSDSWWERRHVDENVLPKSGDQSVRAKGGISLGQTLSHARSLLASAEVLREKEPDLATTLRERGAALVGGILSQPQPRAAEGALVTFYDVDRHPREFTSPWASNRGTPSSAKMSVNLLHAASLVGDDRGKEIVTTVSQAYKEQFIPREQILRAGDPGAVIELLGELFRTTQDWEWLDTAMVHATDAMELYLDCPLPRCALGRTHYEAQQGSSVLVHALSRLYLLAEGKKLSGGLAEVYV